MTLQELAKALRGDVNGNWINVRGRGHSAKDRSLGFRFDPDAPNGFRVHSFPGDDPAASRAHVLALLQKLTAGDLVTVECKTAAGDEAAAQWRIGSALAIWNQAEPIAGTLAATYLAARGCPITKAVVAADALRFHPHCPFGGYSVPALVVLVRDVVTGERVGIHRTALSDDGLGKRTFPGDAPSKMMMGRTKGAAVMLQHASTHLGIAEGIETALSAGQIFEMPVWATMSAGGIAEFPLIHGLKHLTIFADHDVAGLQAARTCARRYQNKMGTEVRVRCPTNANTDWNDYLVKEQVERGD